MSINKIEVICAPCNKCVRLEKELRQMVKSIGLLYKLVIPFEFKHNMDLNSVSKYNVNVSQTPAILVNGIVEFAGKFDLQLVRKRLESIHKSC